jgi:hypothetical protein
MVMTTTFSRAAWIAALLTLFAALSCLALTSQAHAACGPAVVDPLTAPAAPVAPATATVVRGAIVVSANINTPCEDASLLVQAKLRQDGAEKASVTLTPSVTPGPGVTSLTATGAIATPGDPALPDGLYTVEVVAGETGHPSHTSQTVALLVDNTAPALSFTGGPADGAQIAAGQQGAWTFAAGSDLTAPVAFRCAYDGGQLGACGALAAAGSLPAGSHTFRVEGTDGAGNVAAIARAFTVAAAPVAAPPVVDPEVFQQKAAPKCRVPNLRGLTLAAAKRKLKARGCRLGKVTRTPARIRAKFPGEGALRVQKQSIRAGSVRAGGQRIGLALVQRRDLKLVR